MKELQRRTIGLLVLCFSITALILILIHSYNKKFEAQEHRLNEQKRLLIALTNKVNEQSANKRN